MTAITIDKAIEAWSLVQGAEKEVKRLETNFKAHRLELEDAEEKEYMDKRVKLWLDKFRYVSYDMEDVLDEWETAVQQLETDLSGSTSVRNWKIQCRGRDAVPENASVNTFVYEVSQFLLRQKSNKYILVHCTHGHNRTGYMIIHYLMRTQPMSVTRAIKFFSEARPPGIHKPDYIDALYAFYHERRPESFVCPPTPEWKRSSDLDLNGEATADDDDDDDDGAPTALPRACTIPGITSSFTEQLIMFEQYCNIENLGRVNKVKVKRRITVESLQLEPLCNQNTLIQDGKEMASVLYTYRSYVEALPQVPQALHFLQLVVVELSLRLLGRGPNL
ncbi:hypothetical protein PVK06_024894 [Gossypium arboreum]|uniref:Tyrosine specific protein phosphatases domain-containing protein n=1 Tax=Gossypium arboreum TaxID=29729 RepID=A0ABR0PF58_GOSAR|nr:hypothetical protein PVK06_024894 [Gossypium arboreum]